MSQRARNRVALTLQVVAFIVGAVGLLYELMVDHWKNPAAGTALIGIVSYPLISGVQGRDRH